MYNTNKQGLSFKGSALSLGATRVMQNENHTGSCGEKSWLMQPQHEDKVVLIHLSEG